MLRRKTSPQGDCRLFSCSMHLWRVAVQLLSCSHLHGSWPMTTIFELIMLVVTHTRQVWTKCGFWRRMVFNECILKSSLCETSSQFTSRRSLLLKFLPVTYLWPFPISSTINMFLNLIVEKEGSEGFARPQLLCKYYCRCTYRSILLFLASVPSSPLYTFFLPDFILPGKVTSHLKFLQSMCDWQNICPDNVLISPRMINVSISCFLNPQVLLKLWLLWLRTDEEKFEMQEQYLPIIAGNLIWLVL